jgi:hypothetical protein
MNVNINKTRGDSIIDELAKFGYEAYAHDGSAQVLIRPIDQSSDAHPRTLPIELTSQLNNARGSVLIALRMRAVAKAETAPVAPAIDATVIKTPGFGDILGDSGLKLDPILRTGEDFGAE